MLQTTSLNIVRKVQQFSCHSNMGIMW